MKQETIDMLERSARVKDAAHELLAALELTHKFHSRFFCRESIEDFRALGYTGTEDGNEMKGWLFELQASTLRNAKGEPAP